MNGKRCSSGSSKHHESYKIKTIHPIDEAIFNIPEEIIVEILVRLPVKSLLKFRCVCKSWLSTISSSQFVKTHLTVSSNKADFSNYRVLINIWGRGIEFKQCSLHSVIFEPLTVASVIDSPLIDSPEIYWVVGSCNGLICLGFDKMSIYLWNPSTRVSRKLSPVVVNLRQGFHCLWGFGYDETDDDYKIVGIFQVSRNDVVLESIVKIYSLKTNSWKRINDFNGAIPLGTSSNFASGKLHFLALMDRNDRLDIVSLDLNSEEYATFELPDDNDEVGCSHFNLGVLSGCICVLCDYTRIRVDVWVLKKYGVKDSWTKVATILDIYGPANCLYHFPLCMLPNGDVVFPVEVHSKIYNSKEKYFRSLGATNLDPDFLMEMDVYVESLVSPLVEEG